MSQRSSMRSIAKARLQAMGVSHVNEVMGLGLSNSKNRRMQRTSQGRKQLANIQKKHIPVWRRVTTGSLAREGFKAQMGIGKKRRFRVAQ